MKAVLLVPVAQHQTRFVVPGLKTDARGVATGRVAAMLLPSLDRVVAALSTLTGEIAQPELYAGLVVESGPLGPRDRGVPPPLRRR